MDISLIEQAGLTKNEALVYVALLKRGKSTSGEVINEASVSSGKIYETLEKLIKKGLVTYIVVNGVKQFLANHPKTLLEYVDEQEAFLKKRKEDVKRLLPELELLKEKDYDKENVDIIKGFRGIKSVVYDALENGENILVMGLRSGKDVKFNNFWKQWHRRRVELDKHAKVLFSDKKTPYWNFFKRLKHTEVREFLKASPAATLIIDNHCFLFTYEGNEFTCIHIISKAVSDSYKGFFEGLWNVAETTEL